MTGAVFLVALFYCPIDSLCLATSFPPIARPIVPPLNATIRSSRTIVSPVANGFPFLVALVSLALRHM